MFYVNNSLSYNAYQMFNHLSNPFCNNYSGRQRKGVSQALAKIDVFDCIIYGHAITFYDSLIARLVVLTISHLCETKATAN